MNTYPYKTQKKRNIKKKKPRRRQRRVSLQKKKNKVHDINDTTQTEIHTQKQKKYVEKMKLYVEQKKIARHQIRNKKIIKFLKTGFSIGLVAIEIALLCI